MPYRRIRVKPSAKNWYMGGTKLVYYRKPVRRHGTRGAGGTSSDAGCLQVAVGIAGAIILCSLVMAVVRAVADGLVLFAGQAAWQIILEAALLAGGACCIIWATWAQWQPRLPGWLGTLFRDPAGRARQVISVAISIILVSGLCGGMFAAGSAISTARTTQAILALSNSAAPTDTPAPAATPTPTPTAVPTATDAPCVTLNCNPWGFNFSCCSAIYSPPSDFCSYFGCIGSFWAGGGYVVECGDELFSLSGGIQGACSYHGGVWRALLKP